MSIGWLMWKWLDKFGFLRLIFFDKNDDFREDGVMFRCILINLGFWKVGEFNEVTLVLLTLDLL